MSQGQPPLVMPPLPPTVTSNATSDNGKVEQLPLPLPPNVAVVTSTPAVDTVDVTINATHGTSETTAAVSTTTTTTSTTSEKTPDGM